jgi:hypothetical protein
VTPGPPQSGSPATRASATVSLKPYSQGPPDTGGASIVNAQVAPCAASQLSFSAVFFDDAEGHDQTELIVTNTSKAECSLMGFPKVSFRSQDGQSVLPPAGDAAVKEPPRVGLPPGGVSSAELDQFPRTCTGSAAKYTTIVLQIDGRAQALTSTYDGVNCESAVHVFVVGTPVSS